MSDFDLDVFLPYRLDLLAQRLSRDLDNRYWKKFGIGVPEWRVLAHLRHAGGASVRDIVIRANLHKSTVSRASRRLEKANYISLKRNSDDRRLVEMELTGPGRQLMAELTPLAAGYQDDLLTSLGEDREAFLRGLTRLLGSQP